MTETELEERLLQNELAMDIQRDEAIERGKACANCKHWIDRFCLHPKRTWIMTFKYFCCERWEKKDEQTN